MIEKDHTRRTAEGISIWNKGGFIPCWRRSLRIDEDSIVVTPELSAKDVDGWDSLTHIRLMLTAEKAFKIKLSTSEVGMLQNVGDLVRSIEGKL